MAGKVFRTTWQNVKHFNHCKITLCLERGKRGREHGKRKQEVEKRKNER